MDENEDEHRKVQVSTTHTLHTFAWRWAKLNGGKSSALVRHTLVIGGGRIIGGKSNEHGGAKFCCAACPTWQLW